MNAGRAALTARLGHTFRDPSLLDAALTHRSARARHNERLEFLGDAVLNLVIADGLYRRHPDAREGELTRMRAALVRAETLAAIGAELALGDLMDLGAGELKSGGHRRGSILGDAVEALIGAVYLDAGYEAAHGAVLGLFAARLDEPPDPESLKDAKTRLQEILQGRQLDRPDYRLVEESGEPHLRSFRVACDIPALSLSTEGVGGSRRKAEQAAAEAMLGLLGDDGDG